MILTGLMHHTVKILKLQGFFSFLINFCECKPETKKQSLLVPKPLQQNMNMHLQTFLVEEVKDVKDTVIPPPPTPPHTHTPTQNTRPTN